MNDDIYERMSRLSPGLYETGTTNRIATIEECISLKYIREYQYKGELCICLCEREGFNGDFVVPSGYVEVDFESYCGLYENPRIHSLFLPLSVKEVNMPARNAKYMHDVQVEKGSKHFVSTCGCLVKKSDCALLLGFGGVVPEGVKVIESDAYIERDFGENLVIPESVTLIKENAFRLLENIKTITILGNAKVEKNAFAICGGAELDCVVAPNALEISRSAFCGKYPKKLVLDVSAKYRDKYKLYTTHEEYGYVQGYYCGTSKFEDYKGDKYFDITADLSNPETASNYLHFPKEREIPQGIEFMDYEGIKKIVE